MNIFVRWLARLRCVRAAFLCYTPFTTALAQAPKERVTIRYGYLPIPVVPMFAAKALGKLEKEGMIQLIKFTSGPAEFQALQSGSIDTCTRLDASVLHGLDTRAECGVRVPSFGNYGPLKRSSCPKGGTIPPPEGHPRQEVRGSGLGDHFEHVAIFMRCSRLASRRRR